jgi:hypothetical protein
MAIRSPFSIPVVVNHPPVTEFAMTKEEVPQFMCQDFLSLLMSQVFSQVNDLLLSASEPTPVSASRIELPEGEWKGLDLHSHSGGDFIEGLPPARLL